jgi:hypothetical protein
MAQHAAAIQQPQVRRHRPGRRPDGAGQLLRGGLAAVQCAHQPQPQRMAEGAQTVRDDLGSQLTEGV